MQMKMDYDENTGELYNSAGDDTYKQFENFINGLLYSKSGNVLMNDYDPDADYKYADYRKEYLNILAGQGQAQLNLIGGVMADYSDNNNTLRGMVLEYDKNSQLTTLYSTLRIRMEGLDADTVTTIPYLQIDGLKLMSGVQSEDEAGNMNTALFKYNEHRCCDRLSDGDSTKVYMYDYENDAFVGDGKKGYVISGKGDECFASEGTDVFVKKYTGSGAAEENDYLECGEALKELKAAEKKAAANITLDLIGASQPWIRIAAGVAETGMGLNDSLDSKDSIYDAFDSTAEAMNHNGILSDGVHGAYTKTSDVTNAAFDEIISVGEAYSNLQEKEAVLKMDQSGTLIVAHDASGDQKISTCTCDANTALKNAYLMKNGFSFAVDDETSKIVSDGLTGNYKDNKWSEYSYSKTADGLGLKNAAEANGVLYYAWTGKNLPGSGYDFNWNDFTADQIKLIQKDLLDYASEKVNDVNDETGSIYINENAFNDYNALSGENSKIFQEVK